MVAREFIKKIGINKLKYCDSIQRSKSIWEAKDGWYWADECWNEYGPLMSEEEAKTAQDKYVIEILGV